MATYSLHRLSRFYNHTFSLSCHFNSLFVNNYHPQFRIALKCINISSEMKYSNIGDIDESTTRKKKKAFVPRVTLLSEKDEMSVVTMEEAEKIAKRQNLKLIKVVDFDTKTKREIYKLMKIREYVEADAAVKVKERAIKEKTVKEEKTITVSSKISDHDLEIKIKSIHKMLGKRHSVRAVISLDESKQKANEIANCIVTKTKDIAKVTMTNSGGHNVKVFIRPNLDEPTNQESEKVQTSSTDYMK